MGALFPDQYGQDTGRPQPRQPRLGGPRQYLLLDRPVARRQRRDPDAAIAVRGQEMPGSLRRLRARRLCRARRNAEGGVSFYFPARSNGRAGKSPQTLPGPDLCASSISPARASTYGEADLTEIADSYVCGVSDAPLLGHTIGHSLDQAARRWADREALVSPSHGVRWTWEELNGQ